jgi:hypothetical protein
MEYKEIDGVIYDLSKKAVDFHNDVMPEMETITETLIKTNGDVSQDDWDAKNAVVDSYTKGTATIMNGLLDYVHRKVGANDSDK